MKKYLFIFLVFSKLVAQDIQTLKARDTIYLSFKNGEEFKGITSKEAKNKYNSRYSYKFPDSKELAFFTLPNQKGQKRVRKEINQMKVYTIESLHSIGIIKAISTLYNNKIVIFLMEKNKCNGRNVVLKRIYLENKVETEM